MTKIEDVSTPLNSLALSRDMQLKHGLSRDLPETKQISDIKSNPGRFPQNILHHVNGYYSLVSRDLKRRKAVSLVDET